MKVLKVGLFFLCGVAWFVALAYAIDHIEITTPPSTYAQTVFDPNLTHLQVYTQSTIEQAEYIIQYTGYTSDDLLAEMTSLYESQSYDQCRWLAGIWKLTGNTLTFDQETVLANCVAD